jgi:phosphoribosylanthranilate isomerase
VFCKGPHPATLRYLEWFMRPRAKICGITDLVDLEVALEAGADAVGFLVGPRHPSTDFIEPSRARELAEAVPPFVTTVLVTHEDDVSAIALLAEAVPTQYIQLHSDMSAEQLAVARERLHPRRLIGKVSVENESSLRRALEISPVVDFVLLDSINRNTGQVGGTGLTHDWNISSLIRRTIHRPVILAGGLNPDNVRAAVQAVQPAAVDVNSGVEEDGGRKSSRRASEFVARLRDVS